LQHVVDSFACFRVTNAVEFQNEPDVVTDTERRDEIKGLVDEADVLVVMMLWPATSTSPESGASMPLIRFSNVDFPEPLRPRSATVSPLMKSAFRSSRTRCFLPPSS
jgi:hypothetical protein